MSAALYDALKKKPPIGDDGEEDSEGQERSQGGGDARYEDAGRAITEAHAAGDHEGLARAICDLMDVHKGATSAKDHDGGTRGERMGSGMSSKQGSKPNLSVVLAGKGK